MKKKGCGFWHFYFFFQVVTFLSKLLNYIISLKLSVCGHYSAIWDNLNIFYFYSYLFKLYNCKLVTAIVGNLKIPTPIQGPLNVSRMRQWGRLSWFDSSEVHRPAHYVARLSVRTAPSAAPASSVVAVGALGGVIILQGPWEEALPTHRQKRVTSASAPHNWGERPDWLDCYSLWVNRSEEHR